MSIQRQFEKGVQLHAATQIVAASSALWKFAYRCNQAAANPLSREEFKATQQELGAELMRLYKPALLKSTERAAATATGLLSRIGQALAAGDMVKVGRLIQNSPALGTKELGVLGTIADFYLGEQE